MMAVAGEVENERRQLLIAVLCILVVKLAVFFLIIPIFKDEIGTFYGIGSADNYAWIAKSIDLGYGYRVTPDTALTLMREPGYPYFLAALLFLFENDHGAAVAANLIFTSLAALLISRLARFAWSGRRMFLIAPLLFLLHPGIVIAELRGGVEIPFTLLLLCFLLLLRRAFDSGSTAAYIKAGLMLGLTSCVRSTALLFPAFLFVKDVIFVRSWGALARAVFRTALLVACALLVLSPWIMRNYTLVGQFVPTASVGGVTLQAGNYICTHADGRRSFQELDADAGEVRNKLATEQGYRFKPGYYQLFFDPRDEVSFNDSLGRQVVRQYLQSPATFLKCASRNALNFWIAGKNRSATIANIAIQLPYVVLALVGMIIGLRGGGRSTIVLLLMFVAYTVLVYVPIHAQARYSIPLVPILSVLAAIPLSILLERRFGDRATAGGLVPERVIKPAASELH